MVHVPSRQELISLATRIRDAKDQGQDFGGLVSQLQSYVAYPNVATLFDSDFPADLIVDYALGWQEKWPVLTHPEMTQLVENIVDAEGTEAELKLLIELFDSNCQHPAKNSLIYCPEEYFDGNPNPSVEQIVEKAMTMPSSQR